MCIAYPCFSLMFSWLLKIVYCVSLMYSELLLQVGVLIGKAGDTIRYLQYNSGAKIQITRDAEADPHAPTRPVEIIGTLDSINKAEKLINAVIAEVTYASFFIFSCFLSFFFLVLSFFPKLSLAPLPSFLYICLPAISYFNI